MNTKLGVAAAIMMTFATAQAQEAAPGKTDPSKMTFFVTSVGTGKGGDLGGLAGADAHCQKLATAAGAGNHSWHAYLSTQGPGAVNARDRIGKGPWVNIKGARIAANLSDLHGDTLDEARSGNTLQRLTALNEKGERVPGAGGADDRHDMLTGSTIDGRAYTDGADHTCKNWTSSAGDGSAQVGHHDRTGGANLSWNSAHASKGCSIEKLLIDHSMGLFYCFAAETP